MNITLALLYKFSVLVYIDTGNLNTFFQLIYN